MKLKTGQYVVIYDEEDPRNEEDSNGDKSIICIIAKADALDETDLQNAAIIKEAKNMLVTLLQLRETLSKGNRGGFNGILATDTINKINTTLKKIYLK